MKDLAPYSNAILGLQFTQQASPSKSMKNGDEIFKRELLDSHVELHGWFDEEVDRIRQFERGHGAWYPQMLNPQVDSEPEGKPLGPELIDRDVGYLHENSACIRNDGGWHTFVCLLAALCPIELYDEIRKIKKLKNNILHTMQMSVFQYTRYSPLSDWLNLIKCVHPSEIGEHPPKRFIKPWGGLT